MTETMPDLIAGAVFDLPRQLGPVEHGKVADTFTLEQEGGKLLAAVRTDRISAFDVVLDALVPDKGRIVTAMSAHMFGRTSHIVANWMLDMPDPNVIIGYKADEAILLEIIVRSKLAGGMWRKYEEGQRQFSGVQLEDGLRKYQSLPSPIVTPTTKDSDGDREISREEILDTNVATPALLKAIYSSSLGLYEYGREAARNSGLQMADTKYEFGLLRFRSDGRKNGGRLILIDELHTPDSSRFYDTSELDAYATGQREEPPTELSKEYFRDWLRSIGYSGKPDQRLPWIPDEVISKTSEIYKLVYERIVGEPLTHLDSETNTQTRMWVNILGSIDRISGYKSSEEQAIEQARNL